MQGKQPGFTVVVDLVDIIAVVVVIDVIVAVVIVVVVVVVASVVVVVVEMTVVLPVGVVITVVVLRVDVEVGKSGRLIAVASAMNPLSVMISFETNTMCSSVEFCELTEKRIKSPV